MQGAWVCSLVGEDSAWWCGVAKNENEIKTLWGYSFTPFWCLCQKLSLSPLYFNKTLLHKSSELSSLVPGPGLNSSPPGAKNPSVFAWINNNLSPAWRKNCQQPLKSFSFFHFSLHFPCLTIVSIHEHSLSALFIQNIQCPYLVLLTLLPCKEKKNHGFKIFRRVV